MAVLETLKAAGVFSLRRPDQRVIGQVSEKATRSEFSSAFSQQLALQHALDARLARLTPIGPVTRFDFGQDHDVSHLPTEQGKFVLKKLKPTSRAHLAFGLGVPPHEIPPDTDVIGRRRLVAERSGVEVDPHAVAERVRLLHVMATTYLDGGTGTIWPTGIVVHEGGVHRIQRYLPPAYPVATVVRDPLEVAIEQREKDKLFVDLQDRWRRSLETDDFRQLPSDARAYWKTYRPDSGFGANAHFFGLGDVVAIDY